MHVFGHEHYAENLEDLACAGVPIHHPISGKTVGAVDLTCWRKDADALLIALAKTTADQITQALLTGSSETRVRAAAGVPAGLQANRGNRARAEQRRRDDERLRPAGARSRAIRWCCSGRRPRRWPAGIRARWWSSCRPASGRGSTAGPVPGDGPGAGGVVHVKLLEPGTRPAQETGSEPGLERPDLPARRGRDRCALAARMPPGGRASTRSGEWLALQGEPGTGKLAVIRAVHQRRNPAGRFRVLDAAECRRPGLAGAAPAASCWRAPAAW